MALGFLELGFLELGFVGCAAGLLPSEAKRVPPARTRPYEASSRASGGG
ncbi:MAG: hypothetical protein HRU17_01555 [Polyangiaceae bacterium]|nr:hypothetical protein [Polyangiaceae bacterium]